MAQVTLQRDVTAFVDKVKGRQNEVLRAIAYAAEARVKELTPVVTGYLRANWSVVRNAEASPIPGQGDNSAIAEITMGDTIRLVNPVVYARRIEFGFNGVDKLGRHYHQTGRGMAQQTMLELPEIAAGIVQDFSK